jgi:hypothetical protein
VTVDEAPTLRRREAAGVTQKNNSRHFEWHAAKVTRIETARVAVTSRDVRDLVAPYNVHDEEYREALVELTRLSRERAPG